jgi:hypothetical protein
MRYDRDKLFSQAMSAVEEKKLIFVDEVINLLPCSKQTFYDIFPVGSDKLDSIKDSIDRNKVEMKNSIRVKMYKSDNPTAWLSLYKLICTPEERQMLSMTEVKVTQGGEQPLFDLGKLTKEERKIWYKLYDKATGKVETIDIDYEEVKPKEIGDGN